MAAIVFAPQKNPIQRPPHATPNDRTNDMRAVVRPRSCRSAVASVGVWGLVAPLKEWQQIHSCAYSVGTQLVRKLMIAGCGCLSQSNQLYAIILPEKTMPIHRTSESAPATLAALGGMASASHLATLGKTRE